jgi:hypothetical protein
MRVVASDRENRSKFGWTSQFDWDETSYFSTQPSEKPLNLGVKRVYNMELGKSFEEQGAPDSIWARFGNTGVAWIFICMVDVSTFSSSEIVAKECTSSVDIQTRFLESVNSHQCNKDQQLGYLPPMLLECSPSRTKLIETKRIQKQNLQYAALSYFWGSKSYSSPIYNEELA